MSTECNNDIADPNGQPARHPPGRGSQVSPAERLEIQRAFLTEPSATISAIAQQFGRTRETIAACLKGRDFEELREQVRSEGVEEARAQLRRNVLKAARHWTDDALEAAAKKGDHKPAKDLLTATGVIEPEDKGQEITIHIGTFALGGGPENPDDLVVVEQERLSRGMLQEGDGDERLDPAQQQLADLKRRLLEGTIDPTEAQQFLDQIQAQLPPRRCA